MVVDIGPTSSRQATTPPGANAVRRPHVLRTWGFARVAVRGVTSRIRRKWHPGLLWAVFSTAFLVQAFAPRLTITNRAFVIPAALIAEGREFRPAEIVARERAAQTLSAFLALSGALGLAFRYRSPLVKALRPLGSRDGETQCRSH